MPREANANPQRGIETAGGKSYLTNRRVIREPHRLNARDGATVAPLRDVGGARKCRTKFLGPIPALRNALAADKR